MRQKNPTKKSVPLRSPTAVQAAVGESAETKSPALVVLRGAVNQRRFEIHRQRLTLGRDADCDFQLQDPSISRKHCAFSRSGPLVAVEDLGSLNGVYVNEVKLEHSFVHEGDIVRVGTVYLQYQELARDDVLAVARDMLTGLQTQAYLAAMWNDVLDVPDSNLAVLEIEHLRDINDHYTEQVGDKVIEAVGCGLRKGFDDACFLGRWGGGRFLALFVASQSEAADMVSAVVKGIGTGIDIDQHRVPISMRCGLVNLASGRQGRDGSAVLRVATENLEAARRQDELVFVSSLARVKFLDPVLLTTKPERMLPKPISPSFFEQHLVEHLRASDVPIVLLGCRIKNEATWRVDIGASGVDKCRERLLDAMTLAIADGLVADFGDVYVLLFKGRDAPQKIAHDIEADFLGQVRALPLPSTHGLRLVFDHLSLEPGHADARESLERLRSRLHQRQSFNADANLPYPIARAGRVVAAAMAGEKGTLIAAAVEHCLCFVAHLAVASLLEEEMWEQIQPEKKTRLEGLINGAPLGTGKYVALLKAICEDPVTEQWPIVSALRSVFYKRQEKSDALLAAEKLSNDRMNLAHARDYEIDRLVDLFDTFFVGLGFLRNFQLLTLDSIQVRRRQKSWMIWDHSGASPDFESRELARGDDRDTDETYLVHRTSDICVRLSPLIVLKNRGGRGRVLHWTRTLKLSPYTEYETIQPGAPTEIPVKHLEDVPRLFRTTARKRRSTKLVDVRGIP
jgi:diguanylate cyclase (GGDEF)-like protein